jgi:hypothetical protein
MVTCSLPRLIVQMPSRFGGWAAIAGSSARDRLERPVIITNNSSIEDSGRKNTFATDS